MSLRTSPYERPQLGLTDDAYIRADISPLLQPATSTLDTPSLSLMIAIASPTS
jgi:hypothetical protein